MRHEQADIYHTSGWTSQIKSLFDSVNVVNIYISVVGKLTMYKEIQLNFGTENYTSHLMNISKSHIYI